MKKRLMQLFLLILSILSGSHLYSQETSLLPDNLRWSEADIFSDGELSRNYHYFITKGDTVIDNIKRNKLYFRRNVEGEEEKIYGFMHLERNKLIARINDETLCEERNKDFILYNFNLSVGDSIVDVCLSSAFSKVYDKVVEIDSILVGDIYKKRFLLDRSDYFLIEGIGSSRGLFYPVQMGITGSYYQNLVCVCQNEDLLYMNPDFNECFSASDNPYRVEIISHKTTFCTEHFPQFVINSFVYTGGSYPFTYKWSGLVKDEYGQIYPASHFLNDTTQQNPQLVAPWGNNLWNQFIIEIKDNNGRITKDSINIRFSQYDAVPTEIIPIFINPGDSILFDASIIDVGGIRPYVSYEWTPRDWLSHPDSSITWCKPEASKEYICTVTDSSGCQNLMGSIAKTIVVNPASISSETATKNVYQSGETVFFENPEASEVIVSFYDLSGKMIHNGQTKDNSYRPDGQFIPGVYLCKVKYGKMEKSLKYIVK